MSKTTEPKWREQVQQDINEQTDELRKRQNAARQIPEGKLAEAELDRQKREGTASSKPENQGSSWKSWNAAGPNPPEN
jgi:hypothetical protein